MHFSPSLCLWALVLTSCATTTTMAPAGKKADAANQNDWLPAVASQNVGEGATIEPNSNISFSLCWADSVNPSNSMHVVKFIVVRMSDHKVVEQGSVTMGSVKWIGEYVVEVAHAPDQVQLDRGVNTTTRTIDVKKYLDKIGH